MANGQLFKGPGLGTSQWREAFALTDTDSTTNLFSVALATGNTTIAGTLTVTGAQTFTGATTHSGNSTVGGTLGVTGAATLSSTLAVTGATTLSGLTTLAAGLDLTQIDAALTAKAGGGQDVAATSSKVVAVVTTVTSGNDSFTLPAATGSGAVHIVSNQAAVNSMQLFGLGSDTVNAAASGTGIAVTTKKSAWCVDYAAGKWLAVVG